jgi:phage terminase large subunit-like protein
MIAPARTYPAWLFDDSPIADPFGYGERAVEFARSLRHPKSTLPGGAFQLDRWMERLLLKLYGTRHADGTRVYKTLFAMIPRGNRKTTLGAVLALLHSIGPERLPGSQVVLAAADQKQAKIALTESTDIIRNDRRLMPLVRIADYRNRFTDVRPFTSRGGTTVEAVSADGKTQHGRTPSFVLADELHAWPKRDLWEALRTGLVKTPGSLLGIITTAGRGHDSLAFDQYDYARKVALGVEHDPTLLSVILEPPAGADWLDESVWQLVNPGLACDPPYPDLAGMRQLAREGQSRPAEAESFRQLHLNIWSQHSRAPLFDMALYDSLAVEIDVADLAELPCYVGVDLALNGDLSAVVAAWRHDDGAVTIMPWFFLPDEDLRGRAERDGVPYVDWKRDGFLTTTPGNVTDLDAVEQFIRELCAGNDVREIAFDPHLARGMMQRTHDDGLPAIEFRQGPLTMAPAVAELERAVNGRTLRHNGHPILRQHFDAVAVTVGDTDLKRMHKATRRDRIDGAVAATMAVARAAAANDNGGWWASPDAGLAA